MTIATAHFGNFTVFKDATFAFCPGINVLIGENGTGKSHVLKGIYSLCEGWRIGQRLDNAKLALSVADYVEKVYLPSDIGNLKRRGSSEGYAKVRLDLASADNLDFTLTFASKDTVGGMLLSTTPKHDLARAIFLPPREVISIYPGFVSAWLQRQSAFDRTYFDLCVALGEQPLRKVPKAMEALLAPLKARLSGSVVHKGDQFFISLPDGDMEMPLFAEGLRKVATLVQLILNGSLTAGGYLLWDEPEANMNPRLVVLIRDVLLGLAQVGVQIFVATHDFLLTSELSLASRYEGRKELVRFFALSRSDSGVMVETAEDLDGLQNNPIVAEFGAHYDREANLFVRTSSVEK